MKATRFYAILVGVFILSIVSLYAELADYTFVQTTETYAEITGGISLGTESTDDQRFFDPANPAGTTTSPYVGPGFPIGFNFAFNDYVFDVIGVNANGWICFGQSALGASAVSVTSSSSYTPLSNTTAITPEQLANRIAGFARDIQAQTGATIRIETIGTAPNRTCIVQWKNYKRYGTTGTGDIINFQIRMHETSQKVSIAYGPHTFGGTASTSYPQVGMRGSASTDFANRTTDSNWSMTTAGAANNATCAHTATCYPANGLVFEYLPPVPAVNDLQALSVTGTQTPSVGAASNYTIQVRNRGSNPQTNYTVKLMLGTTELGSVAGPPIASMEVLNIVIPWTPTAQGDAYLTGKVILAGDENPLNDESPPYHVFVFPSGTFVLIVGTGTSAQSYPFYTTYGYSRDASIYTAAELGAPGLISGIMWDMAVQYGNVVPYRILMKNTTDTQLVAQPWATTIADAQLCAEGTVTFNQLGWVYFPLTTPFLYTGDNLVVMVENNYGGAGTTSSQTFRYTTSTTASHHYMYADTTPPTTNGYVNTSRPNVGISFQVGGMGSLSGTVTSGGNPVSGAQVSIVNTQLSMLTNTAGTYSFPYVNPGTYNVTCSKLGYMTQTQQAIITVGQATTLNFVLLPSPNVNVTGTVVGSDAPTVGLPNATVNLTGPINYTGTTNASGQFTIPGVLAGNTYNYNISCDGYQNGTGSITIGSVDYNMGTIILNELTSPPVGVHAELNTAETAVTITWSPPGATGPGYFFDFEIDNGGWTPTSSWSNPLGDWQWTNTYNVANYTDIDTYTDVPPTTAHSGTGMWGTVIQGGYTNCGGWSYLRKSFDLSSMTDPVLNLWHYMDGYNTWDYGLILVNGITVWGSSALAEFMPWQVLNIDLAAYGGQNNVQVSFEWYATTTVSYAGWYLDDIYIGPASGIPTGRAITDFTPYNHNLDRALLGYKVWRLLQGQETNEASWTELTPTLITDTTYVNTGYQTWPDGNYRWAVKSVYTGNVMSVPNFSNMIMKRPNDLSALTITGEMNPSVGSSSNYTVQIKNTGSSPQTAGSYTVKIMIGTNEVASVSGPAIAVNQTLDVIVPWIPANSGTTSIYGKVVLPGDTLPDNDSTPTLDVFVFPEGTQMVIIGEGTSAARYPLGSSYGYERDAVIYTEDQFNGIVGRITGVQWYVHAQYGNTVPYRIYLKNTTATATVAQPWDIYTADATLMVEGTHTFDRLGWVYFPFPDSSMFVYLGGNLMVLTETNYGGTGTTSTQTFRYTTGPTACHHYNYQENTPPTGNGYTTTSRPNIGITFTSVGTQPQFSITPASWAFGQVLINTQQNKEFTITNIGGGTNPLIINSINITGSPFFTLQNLPTLPVSLNGFQSTNFNLNYAPTTPGEHSATIVITDNLARAHTYRVSSGGNLRTEHPVNITATAVDVTIYTLPYFQNFDVVTSPALPVDWNSIFTAPGTVTTYTTSPYSAPNCARIYNSTSTDGPYLLAPPIVPTIPMTTVRVRFWAKGSTSYVLSVGVTENPTNSATYQQIDSFNLTSSWAEYVVGFQTYAGNGHFITFKHGNASTSQSIYVDDVMIEVIADNDLAALSLTGNPSPSVGNQYTYTVAIKNWGAVAQSNYQVKLYNQNNLELASATGVPVGPDATVNVDIPWIPSVSGAFDIYGKVILTGDQNDLNDATPPLSIFVHPAGTQMVIIGDGISAARYPLGSTYGYERDAVIYHEDLFGGVVGRITGVQWYVHVQYGNTVPYRIYLKNTTDAACVAQPWDNYIAGATLMMEGTHTFNTLGWNYFSFPDTSNFVYLGGNLMVLTETNYGGTGTTSTQTFRYTTGPTACHHYNYAENSPPTGNGYTTTSRPNIGLTFTSVGNDPVFSISPASYSFGQAFMNIQYDKQFTITNIGGGTNPLIITNIVISGSPFFTLQNLPTLPVSLSGFQSTNFTARYLPTAIGNHMATILVTDNLARTHTFTLGSRDGATRNDHPVELTAECIDPTIYTSPYIQNFDNVTVPELPIDWSSIAVAPQLVVTYATSPSSAPNCVRIYNSTNNSGPYLISPPISATMPVNTMRIFFRAKGSTSMSIAVGAMTNPTDANTFVQIASIPLTSAWVEYEVSMQSYAGTGQFIALKHGNNANSQYIYVDNVMIEVIPQNDLAALSISGETTPTVNTAYNYTVSVKNRGINPQTNYQVKLYDGNNVELASIAGPQVNPDQTVNAVINWTPTSAGTMQIYGKVVLTGDQNSANDATPEKNLLVLSAATIQVHIGDGSQTSYYQPWATYYKSSLYENIYPPSELNFMGLIQGLSFYCNITSTTIGDRQIKVWLGTTTTADLSAGWIPSTALTLVYDGLINLPPGQNVVTIPFDQPFLYLENNLVLMVQKPLDAVYFTTSDLFLNQTVGTNRARRIYSDTVQYDPVTITGGTLTGQFPKTSFYVVPGGVGHLTGTVYGAGNLPLNNAVVQITGGSSATTNALGQYTIMNIIDGTYEVTASRYGYNPQTVNVVIPEDSTVVQNFTLTQMPTVTVTGTIVGSDAPTVGLPGAVMALTGYEDYSVTANAQGQFTIPGVYTNQSYQYTASAVGYQNATGTINVGTTNYNMGTITVNEIAYTPRNVQATLQAAEQTVTIAWQAPDPNAVDITEGFENALFPPQDWSQVITNTGVGTNGVAYTWCRFGTVTDGTTTVAPSEGAWQAGFWWNYSHQDEWLITPQFNCPQGASLTFDTYCYRGSVNNDHYYVKVSNNNGDSWTVLWDATALTGGYNVYQTPVQIDLSAYAGQQIKLAWHADDPNASSDGMWYNWFIDNVVIGNAGAAIRFAESDMTFRSAALDKILPLTVYSGLPMARDGSRPVLPSESKGSDNLMPDEPLRHRDRPILGYKVWRLMQGQEQNEASWTSLTPQTITDLTLTDTGWAPLPAGTYKWTVKAVYTNNVLSLGAFSNPIVKVPVPMGTLVGLVKNVANLPIPGATINAGGYTATSAVNGSYNMQVAIGTYAVTCSAPGYQTVVNENVVITENQTTISNFILPVFNEDEVQITQTLLKSNYPNPFNPETTIAFDVKGTQQVRIEIYNTKGQLIRTLVDEVKSQGHHSVIWNGRDDHGNSVASGIYHYRMRAGSYKADRRMMLLK